MADHHHIRCFLFASIAGHPIGVDRTEALNFCCVVPAIDVRIIDRAVAPALCLPGNNNKINQTLRCFSSSASFEVQALIIPLT
jgi:hypothetical protein